MWNVEKILTEEQDFFCGATVLLRPHCWGLEITFTHTHTALGRTALDEGSARRREAGWRYQKKIRGLCIL